MSMLPVGFGGSVAAYDIAKSVRFRGSSTLTRSYAGTGTLSVWIKRGTLGTTQTIMGAVAFAPGDTLAGSTAVFRDPTAWLHIVRNAAGTYVNGVSVASGGLIAMAQIGTSFDGYMAELNFIDSDQPVSAFGESDTNGVWQPKKYTGTYGTNGFYLPFNDGTTLTNLCLDRSGNANNFTASGVSLTAGVNYDWMDDTPTNNFATLNPLAVSASTASISSGNLLATTVLSGGGNAFSTVALPASGKFYWEITPTNLSGEILVGVGTLLTTSGFFWLNTDGSLAYYNNNGDRYLNSASASYGAAYIANDVIGVAADIDAGTVTFYKNGASQGAITFNAAGLFPVACDGSGSSPASTFASNFGQRPFAYTPPTGFKALSTKNRPTGGSITTSGSFTGNANVDGPFVWLNGNPSTMTINGNSVTFGTHADKTAGGFKVRSSSASYNTAGSNTYSVSVTGKLFGDSSRAPNTAQGNP